MSGGEDPLEDLCREWLHCTYRPNAFPLRLPGEYSDEVQNGADAPHLRSETDSRQDVLLVSDSIPENLPLPEHHSAVSHTAIDFGPNRA